MGKLETASFLVIMVALGCFMVQTADGLIHVVGGENGWEIPPNTTFYSEWAKPRTFGLNDELVFPYRPGGHTVHQVSKEDFESCGHSHIINQWASGATRVPLNCLGDLYFYSFVGKHCEMGQKLHITVQNKTGSDGIDWELVVRQRKAAMGIARRLFELPSEQTL